MFKDLIEKVKGGRTLTFNHWRYQLLHWTFNCDPKTPADSPLPHPLYTHYCPLFWLTNMFVLTALPLFIFRYILWPLGQAFVWVTTPIWKFIGTTVAILLQLGFGILKAIGAIQIKVPKSANYEERLIAKRKFAERKELWDEVWQMLAIGRQYARDWDFVSNSLSWGYHSSEEVKEIFELCVQRFDETAEERKRQAESFAKWVEIARKATLVAFYTGCTAAVIGTGFLLFFFVPWAIHQVIAFFNWAGTWPWDLIGMTAAGVVGALATIFGTVAFAHYIRLGRRIGDTSEYLSNSFLKPVGTIIALPFVALMSFLNNFAEFVVELYNNNCPPITIVDDRTDVVFNAYIDNMMNYLNNEPEVDHKLLRSVEKHIGEEGVSEMDADNFRRVLAAMIGNFATKGIEFKPNSHPQIFTAIQRKVAIDDEKEIA